MNLLKWQKNTRKRKTVGKSIKFIKNYENWGDPKFKLYAKKVNTEAQQLKNRFENLDSNYTAEFEKRVTIKIDKTQSK